jgi:GR25 family glycosyltransferase involved in LPS biosynthesis
MNISFILLFILLILMIFLILYRNKKENYIYTKIDVPILYINLERSIERNKKMTEQFKNFNITNYKRFNAVDGKKINLKVGEINGIKYEQPNIPNDVDYYDISNKKYLSPGELGCLLSHISAIKYSYENGLNTILILEDDISFKLLKFWDYKISELIQKIPNDWDIIQLHHLEKLNKDNLYTDTNGEKYWSCAAYLINQNGQKKIINKLNDKLVIDNRENYVADAYLYDSVDKVYAINISLFSLNLDEINEQSTIRKMDDKDNILYKMNRYTLDLYKEKYSIYDKLPLCYKYALLCIDCKDIITYEDGICVTKKNDMYIIVMFSYINICNNKNDIYRKKYKNNIILIFDFEPIDLSNIKLKENDILVTTKNDKNLLPAGSYKKFYFPYYLYAALEYYNYLVFEKNNISKSKFCCFAYSNCDEKWEGVRFRRNFFLKMQELTKNRVDNLGKCYNNFNKAKGTHLSNKELFKDYKFIIAIENQPIEGYITEKILNPILAGCIPIYYGASDINEHFNSKRIINIKDYNSIEECIKYIIEIDNNDELFNQIVNEPIFSYNFNIYNIENYLQNQLLFFIDNKQEKFFKTLIDMDNILSKNNQKYFLSDGTLLGVIRDNKFIDYDEDIDIGIFRHEYNIEIEKEILKTFKLKHRIGNLNNGYEISFIHPETNVSLDIFIFYIDNDYTWTTTFYCKKNKDNKCIYKYNFDNVIPYIFRNKIFYVPNQPEKYLELKYGIDWKIPKKFNYEEGINGEYKNII